MPVRYPIRGAALIALCVVAGCGGETPTLSMPLDTQAILSPGQRASVEGTSLTLRFDGVTNDSRCPADALCITGGDAVVNVTVVSGRTEAEANYELHTGTLLPVRHGDVTIALEELQPYPFSGRPIDPSEYRATLRITR